MQENNIDRHKVVEMTTEEMKEIIESLRQISRAYDRNMEFHNILLKEFEDVVEWARQVGESTDVPKEIRHAAVGIWKRGCSLLVEAKRNRKHEYPN